MNKFILFAIAAATATQAMAAGDGFTAEPVRVSAAPAVTTDGEASLNYTAAFAPYGQQAFTSAINQVVKQAAEMPEEIRKVLAGNQITSINIYSPSRKDKNEPCPITEATVFLSHDIYGEPFYSKDVTLSSTAYELNFCEIDPYTIESDKPLFIGFSLLPKDDNSFYLTYDYLAVPFPNTCITKIGDAEWKTGNSSELGSLNIGATVKGVNLPMNGALMMDSSDIPGILTPGSNIDVSLVLRNSLANRINTIDVEYTLGTESKTISVPVTSTVGNDRHNYLDYNETGVAYFSIPGNEDLKGMDIPAGFTITKVNGDATNAFAAQATMNNDVTFLDPADGFDRNLVIEEATGTWCGYCPAGIVMMEQLGEMYPDGSVIRIAVHASNGNNAIDRMEVEAYKPFIRRHIGGFPASTVNRSYEIAPFSADPVGVFQDYYDEIRAIKSPVTVDVTGAVTTPNKDFEITANVKSAYDITNSNDRYQVSFVIVENHVGPYNQQNYFSSAAGYGLGAMGGWEDEDPVVRGYYFDDVARAIYGYPGIANSLPAEIKAGESYEVKQTAEFGAIKAAEINLVAMVVDTKKDQIITAKQYTLETGITGIENVEATDAETDNDAAAEYFTLQGVRVANPAQDGIYIVRRGTEVSKVLVK